jgi:pyruvate dehydrogenase E2 component (dihydrolipoamide acetyltransferase)
MAVPITIPRLGWNMEEGTFAGWLKADGDPVRPGEPLFALESEKATEEVEGLDAGFLRIPPDGPNAGDKLTVGTVIGYVVATADEPIPSSGAPAAVAPAPSATAPAPASRERERPEQPRSSPRARRAAHELGIDWTKLDGTGKTGRIRERDVRGAGGTSEPGGSLVPITPIRRTIAARMLESHRTTVPVTLTTTSDATNLVRLRSQVKAAGGPIPSYTDLFVKLVAVTLAKHPLLAGRWTDEGIRLPQAIHIGIAVDTDAGLLVPVVRDVPSLGIREVAAATRELIDRARGGRLATADMQGACFTVTNLGAYGIDGFTPVINPPECAVLGVGQIARRPAVVGDAVVPRDQVTLSLTFDHRVVDGAPAARFLQAIAQAVEDPAPWVGDERTDRCGVT